MIAIILLIVFLGFLLPILVIHIKLEHLAKEIDDSMQEFILNNGNVEMEKNAHISYRREINQKESEIVSEVEYKEEA